MVPTGNSSHKCMPITLYGMSVTHSGCNGAYWELSKKSLPNTFSMGCFSYTSEMKCCLQGTPPTNQCPVGFLWDVSLTHQGWNCAYWELLTQMNTHYGLYRMSLVHIQAEIMPMGNSPKINALYALCGVFLLHIKDKMVPKGNFCHKPRLKQCLLEFLPQTQAQYTLWDFSLTHPG